MPYRRGEPIRISRWGVWSLPRPVLVLVLSVAVAAPITVVVGAVLGVVGSTPDASWPLTMIVLALAGIVSAEASLGVERVRRQTDETPHIDLSSVWAFAAAALLPGPLAAAVVVIIYCYLYLRVWQPAEVPLHRAVYTAATVVLAVQAAAALIGAAGGPDTFRELAGVLVLVLGVLVYAAVNMTLIVAAIVLNGRRRNSSAPRPLLGHGDEAVIELATLSLGALAAGAMANLGPAYVLLVLPPLIILHRAVLVRQLEEEANTDSKTGLLNAAAWNLEAERVTRRLQRLAGNVTVLVVDLDNFKQTNDEHGHLVGDQVLVAVAEAIRDMVRDDDLVGRFGGEEFVILVPALDGDVTRFGADAVASRIRRRIESLSLTIATAEGQIVVQDLSVSIGGAASPADGILLADLVRVADRAMYAAKDAGRNRVLMGQRPRRPAVDVATDHGSREGNDSAVRRNRSPR